MADYPPPTTSVASKGTTPSVPKSRAEMIDKLKRQKKSATVSRIARPDDNHRCPLHENAEDCATTRIDSTLETICSRLTGDIKITFDEAPERRRNLAHGWFPSELYRTFYEISATLSSRVSKDTHVRHRENERLKLREGNAFQTVGEVDFKKSLTKEGIERHLVWNKKEDPSTWISMFDEYPRAMRRAQFHYDESKRIGQRVTIAAISTADLIAATVHGTCVLDWGILDKEEDKWWDLCYSETKRQVEIPIWVHKSVRPADGSSITPKELMASCPDVFISIQELRLSTLAQGPHTHSKRRTIKANGHSYEWLALGHIRESRIMKVIPYDGKTFYTEKPTSIVRSEAATEDWIFDFDRETWRLESEMKRSAALKRKRAGTDDDDDKCKKKKNDHDIDFSKIKTIFSYI